MRTCQVTLKRKGHEDHEGVTKITKEKEEYKKSNRRLSIQDKQLNFNEEMEKHTKKYKPDEPLLDPVNEYFMKFLFPSCASVRQAKSG